MRQKANAEPSIAPLLTKSISQMQAMALVHALQGRELRDTVAVSRLLTGIAQAVEHATGVGVRADSAAVLQTVCIRNADSVAVALVLNELTLNAAKHKSNEYGAGK